MGIWWNVFMALEMVEFVICIHFFWEEKLTRLWTVIIAFVGYNLLLMAHIIDNYYAKAIIGYLIVYVSMYMMIQTKWEKRLICVAVNYFVTAALEELAIIFMDNFKMGHLFKEHEPERLATESFIALGILLGAVVIRYVIKQQGIEKLYGLINRYAILGIMITATGVIVSCVEVERVKKYFDGRERIIHIISSFGSIVSLLLLVLFILYIREINKRLVDKIYSERKLKMVEVNYYKEKLKRDENTRKYRHDMKNHYVCLENYLLNGKCQEALQYVNSLQEQMEEIRSGIYHSGNEIIDAMLNYYKGIVPEWVEWKERIELHDKIEIEDTDLCTILGNLLQNAVEAVERQKETEPRWICLELTQGQQYLQLTIENSVEESENVTETGDTIKADKSNHGFGRSNVKKMVEKYQGDIKWEKKPGRYRVEVNMKYC